MADQGRRAFVGTRREGFWIPASKIDSEEEGPSRARDRVRVRVGPGVVRCARLSSLGPPHAHTPPGPEGREGGVGCEAGSARGRA